MLIFNCFVSFRYKYLILFVLCPFFLKSRMFPHSHLKLNANEMLDASKKKTEMR